jgi:putative sugar O-methyltransferase
MHPVRHLNVNPAVADRLLAFINSDTFAVRSRVARSEYWKHFGKRLGANVHERSIAVTGGSGFYVPPYTSTVKRSAHRVLRAARQPLEAARWVERRIASRFEFPRLMSYERAFDAVMGHEEVSRPILSAYTVNHIELARHPNVFANAASVKRHYRAWSGYQASANILNHYYYQNLLRGFVAAQRLGTILEIGAGNGNFASILYHDWKPVRVVVIDLPEALAVAIAFLSNLFPAARIFMPHEIQPQGFPAEFDFACLTVDQLDLLADSSVDLAINCHSFQEMTHEQIRIYFGLVQRVCRDSGFFFVANRVEKIPCGPDAFRMEQPDPPNRMAEYPWDPRNEMLIQETSRLSRLVQLDAVAIRVERIRKARGG